MIRIRKIRLTITTVVEYEPQMEHYDAGTPIEKVIKTDVEAAEDDPYLFESMDGAVTTVRGEVVE